MNLESFLQGFTSRLRLRRAFNLAVQGLLFGLSLALGLSFSLLGQLVLDLSRFSLLVAACGLGGMLVFFSIGYFQHPDPLTTARFFDNHFGLYDRLATAVELNRQPAAALTATDETEASARQSFLELQQQDALAAARQIKLSARFFWQVSRAQTALVAFLVLASLVTAALSQPLFARAQEQAAFRQAVEQEIARLRAEQEKINQDQSISPEKRLELSQKLEKAIEALEKAKTVDQAVAALEQAQADLNSNNTAQIQSEANDLKLAGQQALSGAENTQTPFSAAAQSLASGSPAQAAQDLQNIDLSQLSLSERQALADQLKEAAAIIKESNPDLASQMEKAANALTQGDLEAAQQALDQASSMLNNTAQNIAQANAAAQAAAQAGQASQQIVQAGQNAQAGSGAPGTQGSQPGQGAGQGNGASSGSGAGQGSGAGSGSSNGSSASGSEVGSGPIESNNGPGDGGEQAYTPGASSSHIGGGAGSEITLPPSQVKDQLIGVEGSNPGQDSAARVPYQQVNVDPIETYRRMLDSGKVPIELQSIISTYFSSFSK